MKVEQEYGKTIANEKPREIPYKKYYYDKSIIYYDDEIRENDDITYLQEAAYHPKWASRTNPLHNELDTILIKVFKKLYRYRNQNWDENKKFIISSDYAQEIYDILVSGYTEDFLDDNIIGTSWGQYIFDHCKNVIMHVYIRMSILKMNRKTKKQLPYKKLKEQYEEKNCKGFG